MRYQGPIHKRPVDMIPNLCGLYKGLTFQILNEGLEGLFPIVTRIEGDLVRAPYNLPSSSPKASSTFRNNPRNVVHGASTLTLDTRSSCKNHWGPTKDSRGLV